jgi:hypothetical protein
LKFIHCSVLDKGKWNHLIDCDLSASIFNSSFYLDAVCESWYVFTDEEFTVGVVVCETIKLGVRIAYPPFYHMYSDLVGDSSNFNKFEFEEALLKKFSKGIYHCSLDFNFSNLISKGEKLYQFIDKEYSISSLLKRKIKAFNSSTDFELKITKDYNTVLSIIYKELSVKLEFFESKEADRLTKLVEELKKKEQLIVVEIIVNNEIVGGLLGMIFHERIIYLKGAAIKKYTDLGAMYVLMDYLIKYSLENHLKFDFGGSSVEGVRFFNKRFGSEENQYYIYSWNNSPIWFKLLSKFRSLPLLR